MAELDRCVEAVRRFNRFYTPRIGVLGRRFLGTEYSVVQVRVIYEIYRRGDCTARDLTQTLRVDAGYMSRLLKVLEREGIVNRSRSSMDHREVVIRLTERGKRQFTVLDQMAHADIRSMLSKLSPADRGHLVRALKEVERLLDHSGLSDPMIRPFRRGGQHTHGSGS